MEQVLKLIPHFFVYMDDVLVASRNHVENQEDLRCMLQHLEEHRLVLNKEKCSFNASQVDYLGHVVDAPGVRATPGTCVSHLRLPHAVFKGRAAEVPGYGELLCRFIRRASSTLKPLTDATPGPSGCNTPVEWTQQRNSSFKQAKGALSNVAALAHQLQNAHLSLAVDASDHHVGGVHGTFGSHWLSSAES